MTRKHIKAMLPIFEAFAAGQEIVYCGKGTDEHHFGADPEDYRVIPAPAVVKLEQKDVPPGSTLRERGDANWIMITECHQERIYTQDWDRTWQELLDDEFEIKRPGEDWQPCHKPAPAC
jgi:hypothetical protein